MNCRWVRTEGRTGSMGAVSVCSARWERLLAPLDLSSLSPPLRVPSSSLPPEKNLPGM